MEKISLLDPKRERYVEAWNYFKEDFSKLNYFLLPKNKFLKKIIIFFYLKILRKPKAIWSIIKNSKINFRDPMKNKIVLVDSESSIWFKYILNHSNHIVIPVREKDFNEIFISKNMIKLMLIDIFKYPLKINYLKALITLIKPKIVVTAIDNSYEFIELSNIFKDKEIKFFAIQNAGRNYLRNKIIKNLNLDTYFIVGELEKEILKKNVNVKNFKSIGSIRASTAKRHFIENNIDLKKKYDICLISEPNVSTNQELLDSNNIEAMTALAAEYTIKFCRKFDKTFIFSGKIDVNDNKKNLEITSYKNYINKEKFEISFHKKEHWGSYKNIAQSEVTIGVYSSLMREAFEFKKKVLCCDFIGSVETEFPAKDPVVLKLCDYEQFEKRLLLILSLSYDDYIKKISDVNLIYNQKIDAVEKLKKELLN